jgi:DUF1126 PH-like domain
VGVQNEGSMNPLRPYEKKDTLRQFLDHDRHVLRFYCAWDDRETNSFGDMRQVTWIELQQLDENLWLEPSFLTLG